MKNEERNKNEKLDENTTTSLPAPRELFLFYFPGVDKNEGSESKSRKLHKINVIKLIAILKKERKKERKRENISASMKNSLKSANYKLLLKNK